ncbi:MAG: ComEC/Rec2 family competence protein [Clostridium sp.]|nr:ComEC/Rec2 family competence protein [Clostridium sp.]
MKRPLCTVCLLIAAAIAVRVFLTVPGTSAAEGRSEMSEAPAAAREFEEAVPGTSAAAEGTGEVPGTSAAGQGTPDGAAGSADSATENAALQYVPEALRDTVMRGERVRVSGQVYQCRIYEDQIVLWLQKIAVSGEESGTVRSGGSSKEMCICYCEKSTVPQIGSVILAEGTPDVFSCARNPGEFDSAFYYWTQGAAFRVKNAKLLSVSKSRMPFRAALFRIQQSARALLFTYLPEREAGVLCAMLLGDKTSLDDEVRSLYSQSGIAHVLAISGVKMLSLVSPYPLKKPVNWAFVGLHIAESYIIFQGILGQISSHCPSWGRGG